MSGRADPVGAVAVTVVVAQPAAIAEQANIDGRRSFQRERLRRSLTIALDQLHFAILKGT